MLIGGLSTGTTGYVFNGDPDENILVSRSAILAALPPCGPQYVFFSRMVAPSMVPYYATAQNILDSSSAAYNAWALGQFVPDEAGYVSWFALALLRPDMIVSSDGDNLDYGMWYVVANGYRVLPGPANCPQFQGLSSYYTTEWANVLTWGKKPFRGDTAFFANFCPPVTVQLIQQFLRGIEVRLGLFFQDKTTTDVFVDGTATFQLLTFLQDDSGGPLMPLPPIPEGADMPPPIYGFPDPCDCVGPAGPAGPVGECTDCLKNANDVALAFADPDTTSDTQVLMGQATRTFGYNWTGDLTDALGVTALADLKTAVKQLVLSAPEYLFPTPKVLVQEGVPTNLTVETTEEGLPYYQLLMAAAIIQVISQLLDQLTDEECAPGSDTGSFMVKQAANIPFPNFGYMGASQKQLFQTILNKLNALLRCCPDCLEPGWVQFAQIEQPDGDVARLSGEFFIAGGAIPLRARLDGLQVASLTNKVPITTTTDMPQLSKFGRVWWTYEDNTRSEDIFIEHQDVELLTKRGDVVGFGYAFTLGVACTFNILYSIPPALQTP
jgi:hypothetical protein